MQSFHCGFQNALRYRLYGLLLLAYCVHQPLLSAEDTIPVVVHVLHTGTVIGAPDNPPDSLILALLDLMNAALNKEGPDYGGAEIGLRLVLAKRSPTCAPTTGIVRMDASDIPLYSTGGITYDTMFWPGSAFEIPVKGVSRWPNTDYLNIWVVGAINGSMFAPGGYAYYPEYNSALTDGIVLQASVVNGENKTAIHELGHVLSLDHVFGQAWGSCLPESDCSVDGDQICDTENCSYTLSCTAPTNPCTGEPWVIADPEHGYTVLNNYMGYTNCAWMYSEDQKNRMLGALEDFRPGLLTSHALDTTTFGFPVETCTPVALNGLSVFYGIQRIEVGILDIYSNSSDADGAFYVDRTCNQRLTVHPGEVIPIAVTGSYFNPAQLRVYLDIDESGTFEPDEIVLDGYGGFVTDTLDTASLPVCSTLRMRVIAELPGAPEPNPCLLTGDADLGVGQIEDISVEVRPRTIFSVSSGQWTDQAVWDCNCIPGVDDKVTISANHVIIVPPGMDPILCGQLELQEGAVCDVDATFIVGGGCQ